MTTTTAPDNGTTGVNRWWSYEERAIPGIGQAMVNVGTGNLLVVSTDVDIPEVGIDLAFRRVYNSQSQHDVSADDNGDKALFGNRWTNSPLQPQNGGPNSSGSSGPGGSNAQQGP